MLRRELGNNLIAITADGSYARNADRTYSDLELMIFVRKNSHLPRGFSKIYDGMLVEGLFVTERGYHDMVHEPNENWYIAGSDKLIPITNYKFIRKLQKYRTKDLAQKCDRVALDMLNEIQETFGKLFNAVDSRNRVNLFPILSDVVMIVCKLLALVNRKPYTSLNSMVSEAKRFKVKPEGFDEFFDIVTLGKYHNLTILEKRARELFTGIESIFSKKFKGNIYDDDLSTIKRKTTPYSSPLEREHPTDNSSPLEGEDKGGGYPPSRSTQSR